ncbi:MAG: hypothetical protein ACRDRL_02770, partial [Sciscionella sp.]
MSTAESGRYSYSWPDVPVGEPDNIASSGQTVQLPDAPKDATAIGLLGSATNGKASGTLRITYA